MSRDAIAAAVANATATGEKYHAEQCPRCRQTLKIPVDQLQRALPPGAVTEPARPAPASTGIQLNAPTPAAAPLQLAAPPRPAPAPPPEPASPAKPRHHKRGVKPTPVAKVVPAKAAAKKPAARPSSAKRPAARKPAAAKTAKRQTTPPKKRRST